MTARRLVTALVAAMLSALLWSSAAMAGQGWYLMAPPLAPPTHAQGTAPLRQWEQVGEFDSAKECARAQSRHFMHASDVFEALQKEMSRKGPRPKDFLWHRLLGRRVSE